MARTKSNLKSPLTEKAQIYKEKISKGDGVKIKINLNEFLMEEHER